MAKRNARKRPDRPKAGLRNRRKLWDLPPGKINEDEWRAEFEANVAEEPLLVGTRSCERDQRIDAFDEWGVEQPADDPGEEFWPVDLGLEETEDDYD